MSRKAAIWLAWLQAMPEYEIGSDRQVASRRASTVISRRAASSRRRAIARRVERRRDMPGGLPSGQRCQDLG